MVIDIERRTDSQRLDALLDGVLEMLRSANSAPERTRAVGTLFVGLQHLRASVHPLLWTELTRRAAEHPLRTVLHEDPMTRRSFEKPRGRPGDAVVLDGIYRRAEHEPSTAIGRAVHEVAVRRPIARALRQRRAWLGMQIDEAVDRVAVQGRGTRILSVGCGHLREANLSSAVPAGAVADFVAVDGDRECVAVVQRSSLPHTRAVEMSTGAFLEAAPHAIADRLGHFDLIYATDAYQDLAPARARRLTRRLFDLLEPRGRLVFSNLLPTAPDSAYMEAFMGWPPGDRDLTTLEDLTVRIADEEVTSRRVMRDPLGAIGYCVVDRAA